jgi:hypothetical protein
MAWTTPFTAATGSDLTAAMFNAQVRDSLNETETARAFFTGNHMIGFGLNSIRAKSCFRDSQLSQGWAWNTFYTDLDISDDPSDDPRSYNFGPAVTLTTGTTAIAWYSARCSNDVTNNLAAYSVAVENSSGTEYVAASDTWCAMIDGVGADQDNKYGVAHRFTSLTSGVNTFVMKYRVGGSAAHFSNREMFVMAL